MNLRVANTLLFYNGNADKETIKWYYLAIKFFMWLAIYICLDIAYSVKVLNWYYSNLEPKHFNLVIQIFKYLSEIFDLRITFTVDLKDNLIGYTDSNYTKLIDSWKSTSRYIFMLSGRPLSHWSKLQRTVALLLTEIKYIAIMQVRKKEL